MNNIDKLSSFFKSEFPFNEEGLEEFIGTFKLKKYKRGDLILEDGGTEKELRFLDDGVIREFYVSKNREKNINFYTEPGFVTDFSSFINSIHTKKNQVCLTDVQLRILPKEEFLEFTNKHSCGKHFIEIVFQRIVANKERDEFNQFIKTAEELYLEIIETKSGWLREIPQYHIASYLGITPETLSRIRKRI